jgi:cation diffusion facilitator CzcD-associated flavoprotein CzcO
MSGRVDIPHSRVAIVGTGFSGLGIAIALQRAGFDFTIFERRKDVGGTWLENTYPGCQCDVPSHLYSFSFAPNPDWSHTYSYQPEIWDYLKRIAERFDILRHVQFDHAIIDAAWDDIHRRWNIETSCGPWTADVLILGAGALSVPAIPALPGIETFQGKIFHSATWDHHYDLQGKRVAVIGTGSSAIQFVPQIQSQVGQLYVFQRTPPWIMPHDDRPIKPFERAVYRRFPWLQRLARARVYWMQELLSIAFTKFPGLTQGIARMGRKHLARQVPDAKLRRRLTPTYDPGCKRILISNDYYPAMTAANVELVTEEIREVRANSIVTTDGQEREIDAIIFGTGFKVTDNPMSQHVRGRDGMSLAETWADGGAEAYLGTTVPGFPNLLLMTGPNTGIGHTSLVVMIEAQLGYIVKCLRWLQKGNLTTFEVRREPFAKFNAELHAKMQRTVWIKGRCSSWYLDQRGRNTTMWPDFTWKYCWRMRRFDPESYEFCSVGETAKPQA